MNITKENTGEYTATLTIELTPEDFMPKVNENLEKIRKKANIPGFRPGKAPMGLVKKHYGKTTILEEVNEMAFENIYTHIQESKMKIIGRPLINIEKTPKIDDLTEDRTYTYVFDIGMVPEFDVTVAPEVEVEYKKVTLGDEAVEKEIEALRKRHASFGKSDTVIEECMITGHMQIIDPEIEHSEEDLEKNKLYRYFYVDKLNENPKLKKLFLGKKSDEIVEITTDNIEDREALQFLIPESVDMNKEGLKMSFLLSEMYTSQPAELNQEFFNQNFPGRNIETEEDFRNTLREELQQHYIRQCDDIFLHAVRKKIIETTELPLPADFVKQFLIENNKDENDEEKINDLEDRFDEYLEMIKWEYIQDKIFEKFEIKIEIEDFKEFIRDYYSEYMKQEVTDEIIDSELKHILEDKKRAENIEAQIRRKKSLQIFKEHLTLKEISFKSFEEMTEKDKDSEQEKPKKTKKKKEAEQE